MPPKDNVNVFQASFDASNFVQVAQWIPDVLLDVRYYSTFNFVGERIDGYDEPIILLTREAAEALKHVSTCAAKLGYRLKMFDGYRPQRAVDHFIRWAKQPEHVENKVYFFKDVDKCNLFKMGYIAERSGHSRGSTIDLTLFDMKTQADIDMGGTFDWFGERSWTEQTDGLTTQQIANRKLLRDLMAQNGFRSLKEEWWHFTLINEPYPDTYFDFPIQAAILNQR